MHDKRAFHQGRICHHQRHRVAGALCLVKAAPGGGTTIDDSIRAKFVHGPAKKRLGNTIVTNVLHLDGQPGRVDRRAARQLSQDFSPKRMSASIGPPSGPKSRPCSGLPMQRREPAAGRGDRHQSHRLSHRNCYGRHPEMIMTADQDLIQAHRGPAATFPKTRCGLPNAGARSIETDLSLLADGTLAVFHGRHSVERLPAPPLSTSCPATRSGRLDAGSMSRSPVKRFRLKTFSTGRRPTTLASTSK